MFRLYYTAQYPGHWIVQTPEGSWLRFPTTLDGWEKREPATGIDSVRLREVPIRQAINSGMPGTGYSPEGLAARLLAQQAPPPPPVEVTPSRPRLQHGRTRDKLFIDESPEVEIELWEGYRPC